MGFTKYTDNIVIENILGDGAYTKNNRFCRNLSNFLINTGHFSLSQEIVKDGDLDNQRLHISLQFRNTEIYLILSETTVRVATQPYINEQSYIIWSSNMLKLTKIGGIPSVGLFQVDICIGSHFFDSVKIDIRGINTTKGWLICSPTSITSTFAGDGWFVEILAPEIRNMYQLAQFNTLSNMSINSQHVLIEPVFIVGVPRMTTNASYYYYDEDISYLGEFYGRQGSLGSVNTGAIYKDSTGKEYYMSTMASNLIFCD